MSSDSPPAVAAKSITGRVKAVPVEPGTARRDAAKPILSSRFVKIGTWPLKSGPGTGNVSRLKAARSDRAVLEAMRNQRQLEEPPRQGPAKVPQILVVRWIADGLSSEGCAGHSMTRDAQIWSGRQSRPPFSYTDTPPPPCANRPAPRQRNSPITRQYTQVYPGSERSRENTGPCNTLHDLDFLIRSCPAATLFSCHLHLTFRAGTVF